MALPLSVLDLVPLPSGGSSVAAVRATEELARAVDQLGYSRLWYAEHHSTPCVGATTPEIFIAHVAPMTSRVRLGAGGVMLLNHSPLKIAESYRLLEALHPGRIDLGLARAPDTDPVIALALQRARSPGATADYVAQLGDDFLARLRELMAYVDGDFPRDHPFRNVRAIPDDVELPPLWIFGSSDYGARLAAKLGLGFAFAGHFSAEPPDEPLRVYRDEFTPGDALARPHAILSLSVFCAESHAAARRMASSALLSFLRVQSGQPGPLPSPDEALAHSFTREEMGLLERHRHTQVVGTPEEVYGRIEAIAARTGADEVMVVTHAYDPAARLRSFELVAGAFGLLESR